MTNTGESIVHPEAAASPVAATTVPDFDPALLDAAGAVTCDTPCRQCGYNLRGLRPDGRCPECSAPLLESLRSNFLRSTSLRWRARVVTGVDWMLWAGAGALLANLLMFVSVYVPAVRLPTTPLTFILLLAGYYGVWLCATPEPGCFERGASICKCARVAAVAWLGLRALGWLLAANPLGAFAGGFFSACVGSAADVAVLVVLARLTARIPDTRLSRRLVKFTWFYAIGMAIVLALSLAGWLCSLLGARSPGAREFMRIVPVILGVPMLILLSARLVVLFIVGRALGPAAEEPGVMGHLRDRRGF